MMKIVFFSFFTLFCHGSYSATIENQKFTDSHIHIVSEKGAQISGFGKEYSASEIISALDQAGINTGVVVSAAFSMPTISDSRHENDYMIQQVQKFPKRLIGFCGLNLTLDIKLNLEEMNRCGQTPLVKGIKLHPQTNDLDLKNRDTKDHLSLILKKAGELKLVVLIDTMWFDGRTTFEMSKVAVMNPQTKIIFAHALFSDFADLIIPAMFYQGSKENQNLYVDISATVNMYAGSPESDRIVWYLRKFGINRVIFGSDFPAFQPKESIKALHTFSFEKDELDAIQSVNAKELFEL